MGEIKGSVFLGFYYDKIEVGFLLHAAAARVSLICCCSSPCYINVAFFDHLFIYISYQN